MTPQQDLNGLPVQIQLSKRRYIVIALYCTLPTHIFMQWIQFQTTSDGYSKIYGVTSREIDSTVTILYPVYLIGFVMLNFTPMPLGSKYLVVLSAALNFSGCLFKLLSLRLAIFKVALVGQGLSTLALVPIVFLPSKLAIIWFPSHIVSTIVSICCIPLYLGPGLGFIVPSLFTSLLTDLDYSVRLVYLNYFYTLIGAILLIANLIWFQSSPKYPSSILSMKYYFSPEDSDPSAESGTFIIKQWIPILSNGNACLILVSYGFLQAINDTITGFLTPILETGIPGDVFGGGCGLFLMMVCIGSTIALGRITDRTRSYRLLTWMVALPLWPIFLLLIGFISSGNKLAIVGLIFLLGIFFGGSFSVGFDFLSQVTYPISESAGSSLMLGVSQALSWLLSETVSYLLRTHGLWMSFGPIFLILTISICLIPFMKNDLNREKLLQDDRETGEKASRFQASAVQEINGRVLNHGIESPCFKEPRDRCYQSIS